MLSNYNIKYICTIYTCLDTCLMSISRFSLRDKVTLRLLKLYFYIVDVVEGTGHKAKRLVLQCINGEFKSHRGKTKNLTAQRSNSNTVWFNFQTYIIFSINLVSQVTLRSSRTDILSGCHLLRCLYNILYFL